MTIYDRSAAAALRMLSKYGRSVTLRSYANGTYSAGRVTQTPSDQSRQAALFDYTKIQYGQVLQQGTLIQEGDKQCLMDANGTAPTLADHLIVGGVEYVIKNIKEINPAGTPVLYELMLRK